MKYALPSLVLIAGLGSAVPALAEPTSVTVRVIAQDAKFIGESMGSARVELRDVETGELLASGLTSGSTGSTPLIMETHPRQNIKSDSESAKFNTTLDIDKPTLVEVTAFGPLDRPHTMLTVKQQRWIMPGEPLTQGDGWLVELPGIAISPTTETSKGKVSVTAFIELMCGCPITPGGRWDANDYRVIASLWRDGQKISEHSLDFVESPGVYRNGVPFAEDGADTLVIYAKNIRTGNSGLANIDLTPPKLRTQPIIP